MIERKDAVTYLISLENSKSLADAAGEVAYAAEFFRWFSEEAVRLNGELYRAPSGANRIIVQRQPIGVSVLVTPWNFPAAMATRNIAPALAAGCTCVLKPASETPLTAYYLAALYQEAGVPAGVVNVLTTSRSGAPVSAMLHDPAGAQTVVHRLDRRRPQAAARGGRYRDLVLNGAWRQRAVHCLRRCRSRCCDRWRHGGQDAKWRRGLHSGQPLLRAARNFYEAFSRTLAERMGGLRVGRGYDGAS